METNFSTVYLCCNKALRLDAQSHVASFQQQECVTSALLCYLNFTKVKNVLFEFSQRNEIRLWVKRQTRIQHVNAKQVSSSSSPIGLNCLSFL